MSKKWESESLGWIHAVRKRNYEKTKDIVWPSFHRDPTLKRPTPSSKN